MIDENTEKYETPENWKKIPENAFLDKQKLKKITFNSKIEKIGKSAFHICLELSDVGLNEGLKEIDDNAFRFCKKLKELNFPSTVKKIKNHVFHDCFALSKIELNENLEEIGGHVFENCVSLEKITIPNSVKTIGINAFAGCQMLKEIELSENLEELKSYTFCDCSFKKIKMPKNLKKIGRYAFQNCENLEEIELNENLENIEKYAFSNCKNLKKIIFPSKIKYLDNDTFENCENLEEIVFNEGLENIENYVFKDCFKLKKIVFPSTLKTLGWKTFENCKNLEEIVFTGDLEKMYGEVFSLCKNLKKITFPKKIDTITYYNSFEDCEKLSEIIFPEGTETICKGILSNSKIKKIKMPDGVKIIEQSAFYNCEDLEEIELSDTIEKIYMSAFAKCKKLKKVVLPKNLTLLGANVFADCDSLEEVIFQDNIKKVGNSTFYHCFNLKSAEFKEGLEEIGDNTFECCLNLKKIILPSTLKKIGEAPFAFCEDLKSENFEVKSKKFEIADNCLIDRKNARLIYSFCTEKKFVVPNYIKNLDKYSVRKCVEEIELLEDELESISYRISENEEISKKFYEKSMKLVKTTRAKKTKIDQIKEVSVDAFLRQTFENLNREIRINQTINKDGYFLKSFNVKFALNNRTKVYITVPFSAKISTLQKIAEINFDWTEKELSDFLTKIKIKHKFLLKDYEKEMVLIPKNKVRAISPTSFNKKVIEVKSFYISKYIVTQKFFEKVMNFLPYEIKSESENSSFTLNEDNPVTKVSWYNAIIFCNRLSEKEGLEKCYSIDDDFGIFETKSESDIHKLLSKIKCDFSKNGYRLPTVAEWKLAAYAGNPEEKFIYSGSNNLNSVAWYKLNMPQNDNNMKDVGLKEPNALDIYDMTGLVKEWTEDFTPGSKFQQKTCLGGSINSEYNSDCRIESYSYQFPQSKNDMTGFRIVKNASES